MPEVTVRSVTQGAGVETPAEILTQARRLLAHHGGDVLLWGNIEPDSPFLRLFFFFRGRGRAVFARISVIPAARFR